MNTMSKFTRSLAPVVGGLLLITAAAGGTRRSYALIKEERGMRRRMVLEFPRVWVGFCLMFVACGPGETTADVSTAAESIESPACEMVPTGVASSDYWLRFKVPAGLMPDPQFDGRPAKIQVHRVRPVYANGKCPTVPSSAVVLIHGRTVTGPSPSTCGTETARSACRKGWRERASIPSHPACSATVARPDSIRG